jgi:hypothetical protein
MARAFGYNVYIAPILGDNIDLAEIAYHEERRSAIGVSGFMDITDLWTPSTEVSPRGLSLGDNFHIAMGETTRTITDAGIATGVATLEFASATGFTVGNYVAVENLPAPFTALNGNWEITGVVDSGTFTITFATTAANQSSAAVVAGTASAGVDLKLDGTDKPFRFLGLESGPFASGTSNEESPTWDDESQGYVLSESVSKDGSIEYTGKANFVDSAYKIMRLCEKGTVNRNLYAKMVRIGPKGYNEALFGFGRFEGFDEENDAGTIVKWSSAFNFYGPSGLVLHRAA